MPSRFLISAKVERSLGAPGQIPTPIENWIEQAEEIISDAEDAATAAWDAADHPPIIDGNGYWNTWDSEEGAYVSTGVKAQGEDGDPGYSPTATVTKSGKVATISITDQNGTTTATVLAQAMINEGIRNLAAGAKRPSAGRHVRV